MTKPPRRLRSPIRVPVFSSISPLNCCNRSPNISTLRDLHALSRTCQTFNNLVNDDSFWAHRIRCQFAPSIAQLYTFDLFEKPEMIETTDPARPSGFIHGRDDYEIDRAAVNSATHYNDEALANRRAKMYVSKEDFLDKVEFFQYVRPKKKLLANVPLMKLVYFYLIDRKRTAIVNMGIVHRNEQYLVEETDADSLTGRIIRLRSVCWLEITGEMEHRLMPGKYEISWRMKARSNLVHMWGDTEFIVVPSHGKHHVHTMSFSDFREPSMEHGDQWFEQKMGQVEIYEPSKILVAIRNWNNGNWKMGVSWDCIELTIVQ